MPSSQPTSPQVLSGPHLTRRRIDRLAARLESRARALALLDDESRYALWSALRSRTARQAHLEDDDLVEALALVSAFSPGTVGLEPYPVQRLGALVLASGSIAEMMTGEGKTLATTLAALALAVTGRGVHVATANEYLAVRDAAFTSPLAVRLGLSVGLSRQGATVEERIRAHACDVTYGTSSSFGFDYLYDNLAVFAGDIACREPFAALVDEADSVLLDEAVTPLLVSVTGKPSGLNFARMAELVSRLVPGRDVHVDPSGSSVTLLDPGIDLLESALVDVLQGLSLYQQPRIVAQAQTALNARFLFVEGVDYLVAQEDGVRSVVLVDANTGRRRALSRLRSGMHEALEAKEGLPLQPGGVTRASVSVQNFFSRYPVLGGMTGTARSAAGEFMEFYGLEVLGIPTHRPSLRSDLPDRMFADASSRDEVLLEEVRSLRAAGRPVLVACESVLECSRVGALLGAVSAEGLPEVRILSARDPEVEADVIARAGEPGAVTVATAMAGRGVDIVLGGLPNSEGFAARRADVLAVGGLAVVSTCRYPSARVDAQLRGRAGRQGEPGSSLFLLSFDEELPRRYAPERLRGLLSTKGELPSRSARRVFDRAQVTQESEQVSSRREVGRADGPLSVDRETFYAFRRSLLALGPWERTVTVVRTALLRALTTSATSPSDSLEERLRGVWPPSLALPAAPRAGTSQDELAAVLSDEFLEDLTRRLALLEPLETTVREELLARLVGSLVLDTLDLSWAAHLEAASALYADASLTARTGQDPERVYRSMLRGSFEGVFDRFFRLALLNLGGLSVTGVSDAAASGTPLEGSPPPAAMDAS